MTTRSRKVFLGRITVPNNQGTQLLSLMQSSPLLWGLETDGVTPSLDSCIGSEAGLIPDSEIFIGNSADVGNANVGGKYQGVRVAAGANFSLQDFGPGLIDPAQIYIYCLNGCGADLTFTAR